MLLRNVGNYQCLGSEFSKNYEGLQNQKFRHIVLKVFLFLHKIKIKKKTKWALNMGQSVTINSAQNVNNNLCKLCEIQCRINKVNNVHCFQLHVGESLCYALICVISVFLSQQNIYSNGCRTHNYFYLILIKIVRNILIILIKKSSIL
jgi:hypothetical protein